MIKGIGIDIIEVSRVRKAIKKNNRFLERVFSNIEVEYIKSRNYNDLTIAGLFSSKESISKALGTGIRGFKWTDIEIIHNELGKPIVNLKEKALDLANEKNIDNILVSITHVKEQAVTVAIAQKKYLKKQENVNLNEVKNILVNREKNSHKGTYGRIGVVGGSKGMSGAPFLTSSAALRTGSGLVYSLVPDSISNILEIKSTEAIIKSFKGNEEGFSKTNIEDLLEFISKLDAIALGPGLGIDEERIKLVTKLLEQINCPVVLDADGINCISKEREILSTIKQPIVLTPHPKEFSRLIGIDIKEIQSNRRKYSMEFTKRYDVILVLKGHKTIVCDRNNFYENSTGNPGMSTAGSGDVLTGIITSLIGQGIEPFESAKLGTFLHGLAGDIAKDDKGEYGLIASDILESIPYAVKQIV